MHFQKNGQDIRVCWSEQNGSNIIFTTKNSLDVVDIMGSSQTVQPTNGTITLVLSINPVYVLGLVESVAPTDTTQVCNINNDITLLSD